MNISNLLFEKRKTISQEDLIYLAKESARYSSSSAFVQLLNPVRFSLTVRSAPPEYHEILHQLLLNEREKQTQLQLEASSTRSFAITVPVQLQCSPLATKVLPSGREGAFLLFSLRF
jgi:hypothetical protein